MEGSKQVWIYESMYRVSLKTGNGCITDIVQPLPLLCRSMKVGKYGGMEVEKYGCMEVWRYGSVEVWKCGGMEVWRYGKCGGMELWR